MAVKKKHTARRAAPKAPAFQASDKTDAAPNATQVVTEAAPQVETQSAPPPFQETPQEPPKAATGTTADTGGTTGNEAASDVNADLDLEGRIWALSTSFAAIGHVAYNLTGVKEALLDYKDPGAPADQETEADTLARAWAPLLPSMSPATQAIMVTVMILLPKVLLVTSEMKKRKRAAELPPPTETVNKPTEKAVASGKPAK